jgi:hypothetical protein
MALLTRDNFLNSGHLQQDLKVDILLMPDRLEHVYAWDEYEKTESGGRARMRGPGRSRETLDKV